MTVKAKIKEWRARYREWGDQEVTRKRRHIVRNAVGTTLISILFIGAVGSSLWRLSERQAEIALKLASEQNYRTKVDIYDAELREREACLATVDVRETYRFLFGGEADTFSAFIDVFDQAAGPEADSSIGALRALVEARRASIDVGLEVQSADECPPVPIRPSLPDGLTAEEAEQ